MGNYTGSCKSREACCRDEQKDFHNAKTFGKRRENLRNSRQQRQQKEAKRQQLNSNDSENSSNRDRLNGLESGSTDSVQSNYENESNADGGESEGISLYEYVIQTCGQAATKNFSKDVDLRSIRLICLLGEGSFAKVFLAKKYESGRESCYYAMKVLDKSILKEKDYFDYIKLEREILMTLEHPFILKMHYSFQCKQNLYLMLDYEGGGSLFFHLKRKGRFTENEVAFYAAEIIVAIQYLHSKKIIYRDLKPENILLSEDGHIRLADFGLAKKLQNLSSHSKPVQKRQIVQSAQEVHFPYARSVSPQRPLSGSTDADTKIAQPMTLTQNTSPIQQQQGVPGGDNHLLSVDFNNIEQIQKWRGETLTKAFSVCGTPQYMSPEVIAEQGHDMLSDWWSLGIVLYELATGQPPFQNSDLELMAEKIRFQDLPFQSFFSEEFEDLVMRLTHKMPERRLGKGGFKEVQQHPFFRDINWDQVVKKSMKPPIVPSKKALSKPPRREQTEAANPYALLKCNFDSEFYDRDINMWKKSSPTDNTENDALKLPEGSFCNLSNFTYDKLSPLSSQKGMLPGTNQQLLGSQTDMMLDQLEMGTLGQGNSLCEDQSSYQQPSNKSLAIHIQRSNEAIQPQQIKKLSIFDTGNNDKYYQNLRNTSILEEPNAEDVDQSQEQKKEDRKLHKIDIEQCDKASFTFHEVDSDHQS